MPGSNQHFMGIVTLIASVSFLGSCAKEPRPDAYPAQVSGTITVDGEPLLHGTVCFLPEASEEEGGRPGVAKIETDGSYWVGNANPTKPRGLKPGKYRVTVLSMEADPTGTGNPVAELLVPERYTQQTTTPFERVVIAGHNDVNLDLKR